METEPALPIIEDDFNEDIDMHKPPTTPIEYLRRVRHEASSCSQVMIADIDTTQFEKNITYNCQNLMSEYNPTNPQFIPSNESQNDIIQDFGLMKEPQNSNQDWYLFCFGKPLNENDKCNEVQKHITPTPPYLSLILSFRHPLVLKLLGYLNNWIEVDGFDFSKGSWIYALVSLLEKPLSRDAYHALRSLVKLLRKIRSELDSKENILLSPLNVLICIITIYFGQRDLADDPTL
ncbi:unnamed protein product [Gordionus sp. m RMFG-2023]|uniref:gem-associated protein 2-like isoform X2 n=1 Tax=Gordionus sp. m RMFG-2023 TaxID=3053472 RepID=UPI0030E0D05C